MRNLHELLSKAEREWREYLYKNAPIWHDISVIKEDGVISEDWKFYTNLKEIYAIINNEKALKEKFNKTGKYWHKNPELNAKDTFVYLLFHELYHLIEAPRSVKGKNNDLKLIHQAIRRGILKAEPGLSPLEQILKIKAASNGVTDFIVDNRFYVDNKEKKYVLDSIITLFDYFELKDKNTSTDFFTITRYMYSYLYGPKELKEYFKEKAGKKGEEIAMKALKALLKKDIKKINEKECARKIRNIFASEDRYEGIVRLMSVLGPYIKNDTSQRGRTDIKCNTNPNNILQDILDGMNNEEQTQFLNDLIKEFNEGISDSIRDIIKSNEDFNNLDLYAIHEFYKKNHTHVEVKGGKKSGEKIDVGKRMIWKLKNRKIITRDELTTLNLKKIADFQKRTGLPMLVQLNEHYYILNDYELKESLIKDVIYKDDRLKVPDIVELYLDSSGSMYNGTTKNGFNDGSRWDMLSHVLYGFVDALIQAEEELNKKCYIRIHNFADQQLDSKMISVRDFWKGDQKVLKILFKPENGYSVENLNIKNFNDGKERVYVVVTDGNLVISGRTERESKKMKEIAKKKSNSVVLFEIGGTYSLGNAIKNDKNIEYVKVHNKEDMLKKGLEVLIYREGR